jgi:hypothetical protein
MLPPMARPMPASNTRASFSFSIRFTILVWCAMERMQQVLRHSIATSSKLCYLHGHIWRFLFYDFDLSYASHVLDHSCMDWSSVVSAGTSLVRAATRADSHE